MAWVWWALLVCMSCAGVLRQEWSASSWAVRGSALATRLMNVRRGVWKPANARVSGSLSCRADRIMSAWIMRGGPYEGKDVGVTIPLEALKVRGERLSEFRPRWDSAVFLVLRPGVAHDDIPGQGVEFRAPVGEGGALYSWRGHRLCDPHLLALRAIQRV